MRTLRPTQRSSSMPIQCIKRVQLDGPVLKYLRSRSLIKTSFTSHLNPAEEDDDFDDDSISTTSSDFVPVRIAFVRQETITMSREPVYGKRQLPFYSEKDKVEKCYVCMDTLPTIDLDIRVYACPECPLKCCRACLDRWVAIKVRVGQVLPKQMVCPGPSCQRPLDQLTIRSALCNDMFRKYRHFYQISQPGIRFCPAVGCGEILKEPKNSKNRKAVCTTCSVISCMKCGGKYHKLPMCHRLNRTYKRWRYSSDVKQCPGCDWDIEKNHGCVHMTCSRCSFEFCWTCTQEWASHDEWKCLPRSLYYSENSRYGMCKSVRFVTKSVVAGSFMIGSIVLAGVAIILIPPFHIYDSIHEKLEERRRHNNIQAFNAQGFEHM